MPTTTFAKIVAAIIAAITAASGKIPATIHDQLIVVLIFIVLDTITGFWAAKCMHRVSSKSMRSMLVSKLVSYSILVGVGVGAAILASTFTFVNASLLAIVAIEAVSLMENMSAWQKYGHVNLGPAQRFVDMIGKYFSITNAIPDLVEQDKEDEEKK